MRVIIAARRPHTGSDRLPHRTHEARHASSARRRAPAIVEAMPTTEHDRTFNLRDFPGGCLRTVWNRGRRSGLLAVAMVEVDPRVHTELSDNVRRRTRPVLPTFVSRVRAASGTAGAAVRANTTRTPPTPTSAHRRRRVNSMAPSNPLITRRSQVQILPPPPHSCNRTSRVGESPTGSRSSSRSRA